MPRNALQGKACGERSEDFSAARRRRSNGILPHIRPAALIEYSMNYD